MRYRGCPPKLVFLALAVAVLLGISTVAPAQTQTANPSPSPAQPVPTSAAPTSDRTAAGQFDRLLDQHPQVAQELRKNPSLINDPKFLAEHPQMAQYLDKHPQLKQDFAKNPERTMHREEHLNHRMEVQRAERQAQKH
jgi:hypothetical protein